VVGHVTPEAAVGGPIAIIENGDSITIDAENRVLNLDIPQTEIDARLAKWTAPAPKVTRGVLAKYAKQVCSASEGAVTDKF
jgi:dihydroxy-acid dehydratase